MTRTVPALLISAALAVSAEMPAAAQASPSASDAVDVYARYEAPDRILTQRLEDGTYRARVPLAAIRAEQGPLVLRGDYAAEALGLAVAPQADIAMGRLLVRHATSRSQAEADPHMRVGLNGRFVAQLESSTALTAVMDEITLNPDAFQPGFNTIAFDAFQRYTYECQNPQAAELWTEIDTARSEVELTFSRRPFTGTLADIDAFLSPGIGGVDHLVIATATDTMSDAHLKWGALLSQAVANRLEYRMPKIAHARLGSERLNDWQDRIDPAADLIVVGTFDEIAGFTNIDPQSVALDDGHIAVRPSAHDETRFLLVASGHSEAAVTRAVNALATKGFPFTDESETMITRADAVSSVLPKDRAPLQTGVAYTFADLGYQTRSVTGQSTARTDIQFSLPVDAYFAADDDVVLSVDFAYGAGLTEDSALNIFVNDVFRSAIPVKNPKGEAASGYKIRIPARAFEGGLNTISLRAELSKEQAGACAARNNRHLAFMVEESSVLRIPRAKRFVELPNLELLSQAGYPYSTTSGEDFAVRVADQSSETIASAWTLLARLGQSEGDVFSDIDIGFGAKPIDEHTLLIGARRALSDAFAQYPATTMTGAGTPSLMLGSALPRAGARAGGLGRNGLLASIENPVADDKLLTVLTARSDQDLIDATRELVSASHWSQLSGTSAAWRQNPATVVTKSDADTFFIGNLETRERVRVVNSRNPWQFIASVALVLFLAATILAWLARFLRTRLGSDAQ